VAPVPSPGNLEALLAHGDFVRSLARRLLYDADAAEDVVQETWLAWLLHPPRTGGLSAWLQSVARNFALLLRRGDERRLRRERAVARPEPVAAADELVQREAVRRRVVEAVLGLGEPCRTVIVLRFYDGLPPRAIARQLGVGVDTVKTRLKRGLHRLRERLEEDEGAERSWSAVLLPLAGVPGALWTLRLSLGRLAPVAARALAPALALVLLVATLAGGRREVEAEKGSGTFSAAEKVPDPFSRPAPILVVGPRSDSVRPAAPAARGLVVDETGAAIPGARVRAFPDNLPRAAPVASGGDVTAARADAAGRFEVELRGRAPFHRFVIEAPGRAPRAFDGVTAGEGERTWTLAPARGRAGRVVDRRGKEVADARVRWLGVLMGGVVERESESAADGSFVLEDLPSPLDFRDQAAWIEVRAAGFAPLLIEDRDPGSGELTLVLVRGSRVRGVVVDADSGAPLPRARVVLWSSEGARALVSGPGLYIPSPWYQRSLAEAESDEDGVFALALVPSEGFHPVPCPDKGRRGPVVACVGAIAPGRAPEAVELPLLPDGATEEVRLRCRPLGALSGRVRDAGGRALSGIEVLATPSDVSGLFFPDWVEGLPAWRRETDAGGRFHLDGIPLSRLGALVVRVWARPPGCEEGYSVDVPIEAGRSVEAPDLVVGAVPAVDLLVTDGAGRPVWGAVPSVQVIDRFLLEQRTGPDGRVRVRFHQHAADAGPVRLLVRARGYAAGLSAPVVPSEKAPPLVAVALDPGFRASGRVRTAAGGPAAGARVTAAHPRLGAAEVCGPGPGSAALLAPGHERIHASVRADEQGRFELPDLPPGPWQLVAREREEDGPEDAATLVAGGAAGAEEVLLTLPPRRAEPGGVLEGTVREDGSDVPLLDFRVWLGEGPDRTLARKTAPGRFRFERVPWGEWTLHAAAPGFLPHTGAPMALGPEGAPGPIEIRLTRGIVLRGRVEGPPGLDLAGARLAFLPDDRSSASWGRFERDGSYEVGGLRPGRHKLFAFYPSGEPPLAPVAGHDFLVPRAAGELHHDLAVEVGATLWIELPRSAPAPVPGERLEIRDGTGLVVCEERELAAGTSFAMPLRSGVWTVRRTAPGREPWERTVRLDPGARARVTLER